MKIIVVGAGVSGVIFAISRKRSHPKDEIILLERKEEPLKKILATGNGKCNIGNTSDIKGVYNCSFAEDIVNKYDIHDQIGFLDSLNIKLKEVNGLLYPISESAVTVRNALLKALEKAHVKVICNEEVNDYIVNDNTVEVFTNNNNYVADKVVFTTGGKSSPNLGSNGLVLDILKEHGYVLKEVQPGLCPIYVKENTKSLDGVRVKSTVSLYKNDKLIHKESGELLFKDKGLSGIVIFNMSRLIARDLDAHYSLKIDLLPSVDYEDLGIFLSFHSSDELLETYLHPKLANYIKKENLKGHDLINAIKSYKFTFKGLYGFEFSQVSVGGLSLKEIKENYESRREKGIYFAGEILDVDGFCGGYNLMWAIASALDLADHL